MYDNSKLVVEGQEALAVRKIFPSSSSYQQKEEAKKKHFLQCDYAPLLLFKRVYVKGAKLKPERKIMYRMIVFLFFYKTLGFHTHIFWQTRFSKLKLSGNGCQRLLLHRHL